MRRVWPSGHASRTGDGRIRPRPVWNRFLGCDPGPDSCGRYAVTTLAGFLATSFSMMGESLRSLAAPVGDPLVLQVDRGRVGAGIVGADDLNGAAVAGAVFFDNHDPVIGLLGGANARQTNHNHGDTVPFEFLELCCGYGFGQRWLAACAATAGQMRPAA